MAAILMGRNKHYRGSVTVGGVELSDIREDSLMEHITYIGHQSYLFKGTVRDNLLMGDPAASDDRLWAVLDEVRLTPFLQSENGLNTRIAEKGANLSGGQCQRLALARALLHDSPVYIFDEATASCIYTQKGNKKIRKPQAANQTALIFDRRAAARLLSINSIRRLCWS